MRVAVQNLENLFDIFVWFEKKTTTRQILAVEEDSKLNFELLHFRQSQVKSKICNIKSYLIQQVIGNNKISTR